MIFINSIHTFFLRLKSNMLILLDCLEAVGRCGSDFVLETGCTFTVSGLVGPLMEFDEVSVFFI